MFKINADADTGKRMSAFKWAVFAFVSIAIYGEINFPKLTLHVLSVRCSFCVRKCVPCERLIEQCELYRWEIELELRYRRWHQMYSITGIHYSVAYVHLFAHFSHFSRFDNAEHCPPHTQHMRFSSIGFWLLFTTTEEWLRRVTEQERAKETEQDRARQAAAYCSVILLKN